MYRSRFLKSIAVTLFSIVVMTSGLCVAKSKYAVIPNEISTTNFFSRNMLNTNRQTFKLESFKGKTLLVNFWATWCSACIKEMPELSALQNELSAQTIQIIGIAIDNQDKIIEFAKKYDIHYPIYMTDISEQGLLSELGNQSGVLPYTLLIDRKGVIKKTYLGRLNMDDIRKDLLVLDKKRF